MAYDDGGQELGQVGDPAVAKKAEHKLHAKMKIMAAENGVTYQEAFRAVMGDPKNAALKQCYVGFTQDRFAQHAATPYPGITSLQAGVVIDKHVKAYMHEHPAVTYQDARDFVLTADLKLTATYAKTNY
ncbi:MAG: hypothetical protein IIA72_03235 [Proteobacteria bacterium]|nr:hypothetical protein [Pseudomonadota bacterium]